MKIGIDIDDTMTNTTEILEFYLKQYDKIVETSDWTKWDKSIQRDFFNKNMVSIVTNVKLKKNVKEVLYELKNNNTLVLITSRSDRYADNICNLTEKFIKDNELPFDNIFTCSGDKVNICMNEHIDILIDDNKYICEKVYEKGIEVLLFDSKYNKDSKFRRVYNWVEIKEIIGDKNGRKNYNES